MSSCSRKNPYRPIETEVIETVQETPTIRTIKLKPKEPIPFKAGQFVELTIPGIGEAPFTPSSRPSTPEIIHLTIMKVGKVTEKVHELQAGDIVGLRGPLGNGYPIDDFIGKEILVVGGGCGFAPLRSLMYSFFEISGKLKKLYFRGGCRSPQEMVYRKETEEWAKRPDLNLKLTVDKGDETWKGPVGVVTTILDDAAMDYATGIAIVCGPPIMMKFATKKLLEMGFKKDHLYLSMEKNMSCGIGKCGHCRLGIYYACKDGPVFRFNQIESYPEIWD
ncbi:MAG: FAD/NAD(P)-binding protein [Candidatus Omnitrophica bacterium]|nr:FAD/NAD(P)-binding protein [Candidatus Omnitrophota bacterium]